MSFRRDPTYLSYDIWKSLHLLTKAKHVTGSDQNPTVESLVDDILRREITDKYPQLLEHQKQIDKLERELIKTL
jgi:hypothetical protein